MRTEAKSFARLYSANLKSYRGDGDIPTVPEPNKDRDTRKQVNNFDLALLRIKVGKEIQKFAEGDGPYWAKTF